MRFQQILVLNQKRQRSCIYIDALLINLQYQNMSKQSKECIRSFVNIGGERLQTLSCCGSGKYGRAWKTTNPRFVKRTFPIKKDSKSSQMKILNNRWAAEYFHKHRECLQYCARMIRIQRSKDFEVSTMQRYHKNIYETLSDETFFVPIELQISIVLQLIIAVSILHKHNIIHNDLSPRNIMLNTFYGLKLIDLDNAIFFNEDYQHLIGTPWYKSQSYYENLNNFFKNLFKEEIRSIHIIAQQIFYMEDPYYLDDPNKDITSYGRFDQVHQITKKRQIKPLLQIQCSDQRYIKLMEELLKALQTQDSLEQIMKSSSFQALKIFIQNTQYRIIEFKDFKLISDEQFLLNEIEIRNLKTKKNAAINEAMVRIQSQLTLLAGGKSNSIRTILGSVDTNKNGTFDLKQFKTFVKGKLNIDIKDSLIKNIFDHLDTDHSKELDESQILAIFSNMKPEQKEELRQKLLRQRMLRSRQRDDRRA